jgi:YHS domain-containing protein
MAGESAASPVELDGYCPVAYAVMGKAVEGDSKYASEYQGKTYYLANGKAKKMFDKSPESYLVAYDGLCATGMAHGMKVASDPMLFVVEDGRTYLFSNAEAKEMFTMDVADVVAKADENWAAETVRKH